MLLGPNGAGKSTIKSIAGLLRFEGKSPLMGRTIKALKPKEFQGMFLKPLLCMNH